MDLNKLNDILKYIKPILKTPYHFFGLTENNNIIIILEDKQGKRYSFTGYSMFEATHSALLYVENEIKAGSLKIQKKKTKEDESK